MYTDSDFQRSRHAEARRLSLRATLAGLRVEVALIKLGIALRAGFDPDQPRDGVGRWSSTGGGLRRVERDDPTGRESWKRIVEWRRPDGSLDAALVTNRDGSTVVSRYGPGDRERHIVTLADGRTFVVETDGATQTIATGDGRVVSRTTETPDGPIAEPVVQPVYVGPDPTIGIVTLGTLFLALSATNGKDGTAALEFNALDFKPGDARDDAAIKVGRLSRDEVDRACPRHGEVQWHTEDVAKAVRAEREFLSAQDYGTAVHTALRDRIKAHGGDNLRPEVSLIKSRAENYGAKGTIRIDVLERVGDGTVCAYDIKTGRSGLSLARMKEIADNAHSRYSDTRRIIVIEVRPR